MFPVTSGSWLILLAACAVGFAIGQWMKKRRSEADKDNLYIAGLKKRLLAEQQAMDKKGKRKRKKTRS